MKEEECKMARSFLIEKLNSDMSPAASDKFILLIVKELNELSNKEFLTGISSLDLPPEFSETVDKHFWELF